jgi:hypothetical protein
MAVHGCTYVPARPAASLYVATVLRNNTPLNTLRRRDIRLSYLQNPVNNGCGAMSMSFLSVMNDVIFRREHKEIFDISCPTLFIIFYFINRKLYDLD